MVLELYHARRTRSLRPLWLMEEMGLAYSLHAMPYKMGDTGGAEYAKVNPLQKVPALIDNGQTILESTAILEYLLARFGPSELACPPQDGEFGPYLQWLHGGEGIFGMYMSLYLGHKLLLPEAQRNADIAAWAGANLSRACALLGDSLKRKDSILARGFSAADISVGYVLFVLDTIDALPGLAPENVMTYWQALSKRGAWKRAVAQ